MADADTPEVTGPSLRAAGPGPLAFGVGLLAVLASVTAGLALGPVDIAPSAILRQLLDGIPGLDVDSGLSDRRIAIIEQIRAPRVALGLLVGATLAVSGAAYQGAFRNPLADPYLLGIAAGAGLGATLAITRDLGDGAGFADPVPLAAFVGAIGAVTLSYMAGHIGGRSTASLILAGVAVASFLTAGQTYVLQSSNDDFREVYSWDPGPHRHVGLVRAGADAAVLLGHRRGDLSVPRSARRARGRR